MLFTYQKRISFTVCMLFMYYYAFPFFESYPIGKSRFHHDPTFSINYIPLYIISMYHNSPETFTFITSSTNYSFILSLIISLYLLCEILFYCRWRYLENYINTNITIHHTQPIITNQRRDHLLKMAAKYATLNENGIPNWLSLWFKGEPFKNIYYDNVTQYLDWAFWLNDYSFNTKTSKEIKWRNEFKEFAMNCIESMTDHQFIKGHNPNISFVRNTDDNIPISTTYRPFIVYLCLFIGQFITDLIFIYILRFKYKYINNLKVWYKIQSHYTNTKISNPNILIHGLGVHYMPYIPLIYKLLNKSIQNDIFCIEIPWTAMSIWHFIPQSIWKIFSNNPSPSYIDSKSPANKKDFVEILMHIEDMILTHKYDTVPKYKRNKHNPLQLEWNLIGHSYGSFIVAGIYDYIKHNTRCDININLPRLILLDPVTLCLTHPTTVSFLCLSSEDWASYFMQQLAARDLMISCTLNKYFHWFEYNLFPEDLINDKVEHVVITGSNDKLIPGKLIKKGINGVNQKWKEKGYKKIKHIEFKNMHHAAWLGLLSYVQKIVDVV